MSDLAVVCGATGGLGPAVVTAFVGRGDHVLAVARSAKELSGLLQSHGSAVRTETTDLTRETEVEQFWARLDASGETPRWLVNVTGGFRGGSVIGTSPEHWLSMLELNLATAWWSCRAGGARMRKAGEGAIVNLASRSALVSDRGVAAYAVAKAGVVKLTEVLAAELKESGVRVNAVAPATIDTPANRAWMTPHDLAKAVVPEAVARVIAFLCSDDAKIITGAVIPVYGRF